MLLKHILLYLTADKHASPLDIMLAYDAGIGEVIPYTDVTPESAVKLVQEAMFARGSEGSKYTLLFLAGSDIDFVEHIAQNVRDQMFHPFSHSILIDPKGTYTLAAAALAKVEDALRDYDTGLEGKNVVILGSGTRAFVLAKLAASRKAKVTVTGLNEAVVKTLASRASFDSGVEVKGVRAQGPAEIMAVAKGAEIIIAAGPVGVQMLPKESLELLSSCKVTVDLNPVPPEGIGGVSNLANKDKVGKITVIGSVPIQDLKSVVQNKMYKRAILAEGGGYFGYKEAYEISKSLLHIGR